LEIYGTDAKRNFPNLNKDELIKKLKKIKEKEAHAFHKHTSNCLNGLLYDITKTSQYIGVCLNDKKHKKWSARIKYQNKILKIGSYFDEIDAAIAYDNKATQLFGTSAKLNFPHITSVDMLELEKKNKTIESDYYSKSKQGRLQNVSKTSKFVGVHLDKKSSRWISLIHHKNKGIYIGSFFNEEDAACAYDKKALELFGENAKLNFLNEKNH
jgi:hypothetical protein